MSIDLRTDDGRTKKEMMMMIAPSSSAAAEAEGASMITVRREGDESGDRARLEQ